jgi:hypothetical protein
MEGGGDVGDDDTDCSIRRVESWIAQTQRLRVRIPPSNGPYHVY